MEALTLHNYQYWNNWNFNENSKKDTSLEDIAKTLSEMSTQLATIWLDLDKMIQVLSKEISKGGEEE